MRDVTLHSFCSNEPILDLSSSIDRKNHVLLEKNSNKKNLKFFDGPGPKNKKKSDPTKILDFHFFNFRHFFRYADMDFETPKKSIKSSRTRSRRQRKNEGNRFTGAKSVQGQINRGPLPPPSAYYLDNRLHIEQVRNSCSTY